MKIADLRKFYPYHEFYFFRNDKEVAAAIFTDNEIKGFKIIKEYTIFVYL